MSDLLKKNTSYTWNPTTNEAFEEIKKRIASAPTLVSPDFAKDFIIYSFASRDTIAGILRQKDDEGDERPIAFMSKPLCDSETRYTIIEKQAYTLVKSVKHFRAYVRYTKIYSYVPYHTVNDVLFLDPEENGYPKSRNTTLKFSQRKLFGPRLG